ncbi:MAG: helix-turn-helix domain-containing protein [Caldilineaceae bacterium]|nr:helix-turn-helix domain-containing protein [Caldilineaceae bacterium]
MSGENQAPKNLEDLTSQLISVTEAHERTQLSVAWIRRLLQRGEIAGVKVGRNWLTTEQAVRDYLKKDRRPGPKSA